MSRYLTIHEDLGDFEKRTLWKGRAAECPRLYTHLLLTADAQVVGDYKVMSVTMHINTTLDSNKWEADEWVVVVEKL